MLDGIFTINQVQMYQNSKKFSRFYGLFFLYFFKSHWMLNNFLEYFLVYSSLFFIFVFFPLYLFEIWEILGTILRTSNSEMNSPIFLKFELIWDFMPLLDFCKFHVDPIKNEWDKLRTELSVADPVHRGGHYNTILEALWKIGYRNKTYTKMYIMLKHICSLVWLLCS